MQHGRILNFLALAILIIATAANVSCGDKPSHDVDVGGPQHGHAFSLEPAAACGLRALVFPGSGGELEFIRVSRDGQVGNRVELATQIDPWDAIDISVQPKHAQYCIALLTRISTPDEPIARVVRVEWDTNHSRFELADVFESSTLLERVFLISDASGEERVLCVGRDQMSLRRIKDGGRIGEVVNIDQWNEVVYLSKHGVILFDSGRDDNHYLSAYVIAGESIRTVGVDEPSRRGRLIRHVPQRASNDQIFLRDQGRIASFIVDDVDMNGSLDRPSVGIRVNPQARDDENVDAGIVVQTDKVGYFLSPTDRPYQTTVHGGSDRFTISKRYIDTFGLLCLSAP